MTTPAIDRQRLENLGPAERIIQTLLTHTDHMVHNRPGVVTTDASNALGVRWAPVSWKEEEGEKVVYRHDQTTVRGKTATTKVRIGVLRDDGTIRNGNTRVGRYQKPGLFQEAAIHLYRQIAEVYRMDNEFVARWASYAFPQEHKDLKVALAAFLLVQNRKGDPVVDEGKVLFHDEDYRDVGEAMVLLRRNDKKDIDPKLLARIGQLLKLPEIAQINRELGFGTSQRNAPLGRYTKAVSKYLRYREQNPKMLEAAVKQGWRRTLMELAQSVGYKPESEKFFEILRWKQKQSTDGRRAIGMNMQLQAAEDWSNYTEKQICERITDQRLNYKRVVGLIPNSVGLTRAIMAATIEAGGTSDSDLIILSETLDELGLLKVDAIKQRWQAALKNAENQRAANIAKRVKSTDTADALQEAADSALKKEMEKATKDMRVYVCVDVSGSMSGAIEQAKGYLAQFLQGFPADRVHVCTFNTSAKEVAIKHPSKAGIDAAFKGVGSGGGTSYGSAVLLMGRHKPKADEDCIFLFIGDEQDNTFEAQIRACGVNPLAFGMLHVGGVGSAVHMTARLLGIPCFDIDQNTFSDPYAVTRTMRNLIQSTPVGTFGAGAAAPKRKSLIEQILETEMLKKPVWA